MGNDRSRRRVVQFGDSDPPPPENHQGGAVEVVVDGAFTVTDVVVRANWRETTGDALGEALRTAANDAFAARLAEQVAHLEAAPEPATRRGGGITSEQLGELVELFAVADRDLARYERQVRDSVVTAADERGVNGRIEVTMSPGEVTRVTVDQFWARNARYTEIRAEALSAFQAAGRRLATGGPSTVELPPSLARLREIGS